MRKSRGEQAEGVLKGIADMVWLAIDVYICRSESQGGLRPSCASPFTAVNVSRHHFGRSFGSKVLPTRGAMAKVIGSHGPGACMLHVTSRKRVRLIAAGAF